MGVAAPACAQWVGGDGGVVRMNVGAVTFKGGSISNSTAAVRAPSASRASARGGMVCCAARHGRWMARTVYAAARDVRCTAHAAGVERVSTPFESLAKGRPHRDAECCTPRVRDTMRVRSSYTVWRSFKTEGCMHRGRPGAAQVHAVQDAPSRYAMCIFHRLAVHVASARVASEQYFALHISSTCRIDACCIGAPARLVCCIGARLRAASVRVA
jgi:hypothetical protein